MIDLDEINRKAKLENERRVAQDAHQAETEEEPADLPKAEEKPAEAKPAAEETAKPEASAKKTSRAAQRRAARTKTKAES